MDPSPTIRTKRSSEKPTKAAKCPKRKNGLQNLNELLVDSNKNAILFRETIESTDPYSMRDCLAKFPVTVQVDLVIACAVLHNFIGRYHGHDKYFNMSQIEMEHDSERGNVEMLDEDPNLHATIGERIQGEAIRHVIATDMWNARINCQRNRSSSGSCLQCNKYQHHLYVVVYYLVVVKWSPKKKFLWSCTLYAFSYFH
ncbi:uncharacterized protein LOC114579112 isoform X1 [Dendrobium catenatum]|uniref:uncharacterized protein LOC114579112 isoform X1 n=1 Tax=Dendrobium catenatum TaxID=906689 RepID=UPI00109F088A|nr:uncharacterized protein LOC114579112 isoform X1 [Dendrobium catenatum]XP_028548658.1 uncharacterized protein LOC114579112 isoform X1 [Dendrobium catenatum]